MSKHETPRDFLHVWTTDSYGNRILRGLTKEESEEYESIRARVNKTMLEDDAFPWASVDEMRRERRRWVELHEHHEAARLSAIGAELELRRDKPTIN
jgi:endonuclease III-like uncharacterized protein